MDRGENNLVRSVTSRDIEEDGVGLSSQLFILIVVIVPKDDEGVCNGNGDTNNTQSALFSFSSWRASSSPSSSTIHSVGI